MSTDHTATQITTVVNAGDLIKTIDFFVDELGFQLTRISPADDPREAIVTGHGVSLHLDPSSGATPAIRIATGAAPGTTAPNGMAIEFIDAPGGYELPDLIPELVVSRAGDADPVVGRASMRYRDLIPSRLGGRFIASHIEVCDGGPVPDLVHHHGIRFQMIFCHRGWVDVVYEDQGKPFRLEAGDCVLQPPHIRHRVLESSAGAQVVEIGCPAEHDTFFDYELELPTSTIDTERLFGGQRFVRHQASETPWVASAHAGFEVQHTEIEAATDGLASVRVVRPVDASAEASLSHDGEFWFMFVLEGTIAFATAEGNESLTAGDSVTIPAGVDWTLADASDDLRLLEVVLP